MRRAFVLLWLTTLGLGACLSPTLPLPPPEEPDNISSSADGVWDVRGSCTPGATVLIKNQATGTIIGAEDQNADGRYFLQVEGEACDAAEVFEVVGTTSSDGTFFVLETKINGLEQGDCQ